MVPGVVLVRSPERIAADPVKKWLDRLDNDSRPTARSHLNRFMYWLWKQPGWEGVTPREVLVRYLRMSDQYEMLDLVQEYVNGLVLRKSSKRKACTQIRSFFAHNRCALPDDPAYKIRGDMPPVQPKLTLFDIIEAYHANDPRYRSMILVKFQSFMDQERLIYVNRHCVDAIVNQIKAGQLPVRIDLPGRKSNENDFEGQFYTYIHKDAVDALVMYFENYRGWPKPRDAIWIGNSKRPVTKAAFEAMWLRTFRYIGKIPKKKGPPGSRYGYNLHEMRDVATTFLHVQAKSDGLDMDCVKFWCGQVGEIDPLKYDKFYQEQDYVRRQYELAAKYLNIITSPPGTKDAQSEELREKVEELALAVRMLQDASGFKIAKLEHRLHVDREHGDRHDRSRLRQSG